MVGTPAVSDYEAKRLQRIQQNKQVLQSLGIEVQKKQPVKRVLVPREFVEPRRSRRIEALQRDDATSDELIATLLTVNTPQRRVRPRVAEQQPLDLPVETVVESKPRSRKTYQSSVDLDIDLSTFHDRWLGKQIFPSGKNTVMQGMCPPSYDAAFNRINGATRWKNAVVLFVNVLGHSGYDNVFTEVAGGKRVVHFKWFAPARQNEETPAIAQVLNTTRGDESFWLEGASPRPLNSRQPSNPVLLFVRHIDGPYIYFGRVGYLGHIAGIQPLEFRFQLMDINGLDWAKIKPLLADPSTQASTNDIRVTTD